MGIDIVMIVEHYQKGMWRSLEPVEPWVSSEFLANIERMEREYTQEHLAEPRGQYNYHCTIRDHVWFVERNYDLFAMLSGMPNLDRDDEIEPISYPRGLPDELSCPLHIHGSYLLGEFDFSWLTVDELLQYDWDDTLEISESEDVKYSVLAGEFYSKTLPLLKQIDPQRPDRVRIVFGFDARTSYYFLSARAVLLPEPKRILRCRLLEDCCMRRTAQP